MIGVIDGQNIIKDHWIWQRLGQDFDLSFYRGKDYSDDDLVKELKDHEYIFNGARKISGQMIEGLDKLKYIGILATGYNIVDMESARKNNIVVTNVPDYSTSIVAQHTMALVLSIASNIFYYSSEVKEAKWPKTAEIYDEKRPVVELAGKTMGIMGYGDIGKLVGHIGRSLGMDIIAYDKDHTRDAKYVCKEELFAKADIISLHLPLSEDTREIINKSSIKKMKDGVILINTSRGGLVNEEDLAQALKSGKVYSAGLDVLAQEPVSKDNSLLACENAIITPHMAWASREARTRLMDIAYDNFISYLNGEDKNKVN